MVAETFLGELGVCLIRSLENLVHHLVHYGPQPSKSQHYIGGYVLPVQSAGWHFMVSKHKIGSAVAQW